MKPYVLWYLLRRAERRSKSRHYRIASASYLKTRIAVALELLTWLDDKKIPLGTLTQGTLDAWLAAGNTRHYTIRDFLTWATDRGLVGPLKVPPLPTQDPAHMLNETDRWQLLHRCLTDESMAPDVRAAGGLIRLVGLPLARIRNLTIEQLTSDGRRAQLAVGDHPLLLPPRLARLLHRLAQSPSTRSVFATHAQADRPSPPRPRHRSAARTQRRPHRARSRPVRTRSRPLG